MKDLEHDAQVLAGELHEDTHILCDECPCPVPDLCEWEGRTCTRCLRKSGPHPMTTRLYGIAEAMRGGMPMERDDLSLAEWRLLGAIRAKMEGPRL